MGPILCDALSALVREGPSASFPTQQAAASALSFFVHAPSAHEPDQLWAMLPPLTTLVLDLLPLTAKLSANAVDNAAADGRSLLLLALKGSPS